MKRKIIKYWIVLLLSVSQILALATCAFRYQTNIDKGTNAKLNDFLVITSEITKAIILSIEKKWDATQIINDILENKVDNLIFKNIYYSYFGQTNDNNWFPSHQDFFVSQDLANKVINSNDKYVKPYADLISQNNILDKIRTYGSIFNTLTINTLKEIFNSGAVLDPVMNFLTKRNNVESFWNYYNAGGYADVITELQNDLNEHNNNFVGKVTYAEALQWSQKRIKKIIIQIGCNKENYEKKEKLDKIKTKNFCKWYDSKNDIKVKDAYDAMMAMFGIEIKDNDGEVVSIKTNDYILENFQNGFKDPKNIISLLVPILPVISYVMKMYATIPFVNPTVICNEISETSKKIQQVINQQLNTTYVGFDQSVTDNLKNKLTKIFSLNDYGLSLRKILLIIRLTPQLNELVNKINLNLMSFIPVPLIGAISTGCVCLGIIDFFCTNVAFFPKAFPKIKEILDPFFGNVKKYLNFIPNDTNINLNDVLTWINKLVNVIQDRELLKEAKIKKILAAIEIDDKHAKVELLEILGYNWVEGELIPNGLLDTIIKTMTIDSCRENNPDCITEVTKLLTSLTGENRILDRVVKANNDTINNKYRRYYQHNNYWRITNAKIQYNAIDNSSEVSYDISFSQDTMNNVYSIKWRTKNDYNNLASNNFKIVAFSSNSRNKEIK